MHLKTPQKKQIIPFFLGGSHTYIHVQDVARFSLVWGTGYERDLNELKWFTYANMYVHDIVHTYMYPVPGYPRVPSEIGACVAAVDLMSRDDGETTQRITASQRINNTTLVATLTPEMVDEGGVGRG